jgi:hypothetical protein
MGIVVVRLGVSSLLYLFFFETAKKLIYIKKKRVQRINVQVVLYPQLREKYLKVLKPKPKPKQRTTKQPRPKIT